MPDTDTREIRLRRIVGEAIQLEPGFARVVADLSLWAAMAARQGLDGSDKDGFSGISAIAKHLVACAPEGNRGLLNRSLSKALHYTAAAGSSVGRTLFAKSLAPPLREENADALVQGFVALHVFDVVWSACKGAACPSEDALVAEMEEVREICSRIAESAWDYLDLGSPLDIVSAGALADCITTWFREGLPRKLTE